MADDRTTVLEAFGRFLPDTESATFDALLAARRWRDAIPASFWMQSSVMAQVDERRRRQLHNRLIAVIGDDAAGAMMEYLPPVSSRVLRAHGMDHLLWD